jgi:tRNA(fMet)-specific endonuclease VapC
MYLIDTNILTYFYKGNKKIEEKFKENSDQIVLSSIVKSECLYGAKKTKRSELLNFYGVIFVTYPILSFDSDCADYYSDIKSYLSDSGKIVGDFDIMITAIAIANDLTLVTNNAKDFANIPGLKLEDWSK